MRRLQYGNKLKLILVALRHAVSVRRWDNFLVELALNPTELAQQAVRLTANTKYKLLEL